MKRFIRFSQKDKKYVKMINASEKGFELVILSDDILNKILETINSCEEQGDELYIVWQMKHKTDNFILYHNCNFSSPMDNVIPSRAYILQRRSEEEPNNGKKLKVSCGGSSFYSESELYKNRTTRKSKTQYKDAMLLERMLKISELNFRQFSLQTQESRLAVCDEIIKKTLEDKKKKKDEL